MDDLFVSLGVVGVTGILIIVLFVYLNYRKRQKEAAFRQAALDRGWQVERIQERLVSGYRVRGNQGDWVMEMLTTASEQTADVGSSGVGHSTRWRNETIRLPDRAVVIGSLRGGGGAAPALQAIGGGLAQMALRVMLGKDAGWASQLVPVETGSMAFRDRFLCMADDRQDVERLLTPEVERGLIKISEKRKPVVMLRSSGLEIHLPTDEINEPSEIEMIVNLGDALGRAWQRS